MALCRRFMSNVEFAGKFSRIFEQIRKRSGAILGGVLHSAANAQSRAASVSCPIFTRVIVSVKFTLKYFYIRMCSAVLSPYSSETTI